MWVTETRTRTTFARCCSLLAPQPPDRVAAPGGNVPTRSRARGFDATDLTGRTAVVTGAGSGIGRSLALLAGERGAAVHVVDVDTERAETVADEVRRLGGSAHPHAVDVSDPDAVLH